MAKKLDKAPEQEPQDKKAQLWDLLREAGKGLRDQTEKKMFGCNALFTGGRIFAMVWKTGRVAVKLTDAIQHDTLMALKGAEPWKAGNKVMGQWVLVPPSLENVRELAPWVIHAWRSAQEDGSGAAPVKTSAAKKKAAPAKKKKAAPAKKKKAAPKKKSAPKK